MRPGMITLTWTSMNIDAYINHIHSGLKKLEALVSNINDIIANRIEKNLKVVSKTNSFGLFVIRNWRFSLFRISYCGFEIDKSFGLYPG